MINNKTILFISHEATRTGAPIAALHMLEWLKRNTNWTIIILLKKGGVLEPSFRSIGPTYIWDENDSESLWKSRLQRVMHLNAVRQKIILSKIRKLRPEIIYANSIASLKLGVYLKQLLNKKLVSHIHELKVLLEKYVAPTEFVKLASQVDEFFVVSEAVKYNLIENYKVSNIRVKVIPAYIHSKFENASPEEIQGIYSWLNIPADAFVVLTIGSLYWNKSPDLFIQVVQHVRLLTSAEIYFIWLGGAIDNPQGAELQHDVDKLNLHKYIRFVAYSEFPHRYMSMCDTFMMTSREDSFGLVGIEAALFNKPIVCFDKGGGMAEFVQDDAGIVIPYLRTDLMAQAIVFLQSNEFKRNELGRCASDKVKRLHLVDSVLPLAKEYLNNLFEY